MKSNINIDMLSSDGVIMRIEKIFSILQRELKSKTK